MEWPKLKNIIILILLIVNLFLLVMVIAQKGDAARQERQALENTISVLQRGGVAVDQEILPDKLELTPLTVERDQAEETAMAAALLGEYQVSDLGSGRSAYRSTLGTAEFRSNGTFTFSFEPNVQTVQAGREEAHALELLKQVGMEGTVTERREEAGLVTLIFRQTWQELPVYSCQITLEYEQGSLCSMVGQRLMGSPQASGSTGEMIDLPTALLRIHNGLNSLGDLCNEILAMEPGYLISAAESAQLIPVWYVTTDTGTYYLNAMTGVLTRAI